nr:SdiA-regulated domain-containing protein [Citrobacter farmeri]
MTTIYLRRTVISMVFIFVVLFYIREDICYLFRLYERYNDTPSLLNLRAYVADIEGKEVKGVKDNLSGLTWSDKHRLLFAVVNNPPEVVWLTPDGERTGSLPIPEITDPEAVEWMGDNLFWVGSEKEGSAWLVNIDILKGTYELLSNISLKGYTRPGNKGLEGLAWDKANQVLFAAKEKKPVMISRVDVQSEENSVSTLPTSATSSVRDVSGLHYHSPTASLLVLSDESGKLLEINSEGLVTDRLYLNAGWTGLKEDIPQAEGIALDDAGNLYIVSEPNLFYRFTKKNDRT